MPAKRGVYRNYVYILFSCDHNFRYQATSLLTCEYSALTNQNPFFTTAAEMANFLYRHKIIAGLELEKVKNYFFLGLKAFAPNIYRVPSTRVNLVGVFAEQLEFWFHRELSLSLSLFVCLLQRKFKIEI